MICAPLSLPRSWSWTGSKLKWLRYLCLHCIRSYSCTRLVQCVLSVHDDVRHCVSPASTGAFQTHRSSHRSQAQTLDRHGYLQSLPPLFICLFVAPLIYPPVSRSCVIFASCQRLTKARPSAVAIRSQISSRNSLQLCHRRSCYSTQSWSTKAPSNHCRVVFRYRFSLSFTIDCESPAHYE